MEDEEDGKVVALDTPDDDVSFKTPGSQETLLDDEFSDMETNDNPDLKEINQKCPGPGPGQDTLDVNVDYELIQKQHSDDLEPEMAPSRDGDDVIVSEISNLQTGAGFSQSDNSLSDRNQVAYCYGNQVEYNSGNMKAALSANEKLHRTCSAPPTPEVVRKPQIVDCSRYPHYSYSSECDVAMFLEDASAVNDVISHSPPVYTQAPSAASCHVVDSTNQPRILVESPSGSSHVTCSASHFQPITSLGENNMVHDNHNETGGDETDPYGNCKKRIREYEHNAGPVDMNKECSDEEEETSDSEEDSETHSIKAKPNSITDLTQNEATKPEPEMVDNKDAYGPPDGSAVAPQHEEEVAPDSECDEEPDSPYAHLSYGERSFLLDPAFEGMEPTYV